MIVLVPNKVSWTNRGIALVPNLLWYICSYPLFPQTPPLHTNGIGTLLSDLSFELYLDYTVDCHHVESRTDCYVFA